MCSSAFGNQAPLILRSNQATKLTNDNFFFTQMNKNVTGSLNLEDNNNNLVLSFQDSSPIGTIFYNLEKDDRGNQNYYFFNCSKIYFRMPGEHTIDGLDFDMELQFNCSGVIPGDRSGNSKNAFVSIPVIKVKNYVHQSQFFSDLENLAELGQSVTITHFEDAFDSFNMYKQIYFYTGGMNYPQCMIGANWIVVNNSMKIKEKVYKKLFDMLDKSRIVDGNNRKPSPNSESYYILESNFK